LPLLSLLLLAIFGLPSLLAKAEPMPPPQAKLVSPGDMNTGALLLESEDGFVEAPRLKTDVVIDVTGTIARTVVTQRFEAMDGSKAFTCSRCPSSPPSMPCAWRSATA
jgi:hypothetical protein